jgi:hypothetical protein
MPLRCRSRNDRSGVEHVRRQRGLRNNAPVPVPVEIVRDWVDVLVVIIQIASLIVTSGTVVLAYLQIRQASREAKKAQAAQLEARRIDFELTALRELLIAASLAAPDAARVKALASTLHQSVVPITRAAVHLPTTDDAKRMVEPLSSPHDLPHEQSTLDVFRDEVTDELLSAINERVHERELSG